MAAALYLARRGLGQTWPNPSVGCVITDMEGHIAGRGFTQAGGRPHAETQALAMAGERARGGTAFVTLEPCAHHGRTPPCANALVAAGIRRCVIGISDPDPRTAGKGMAILAAAGIEVVVGVLSEDAAEITAGFLTRVELARPAFLLKSAMTIDGRIAAHSGESRWISGERSRAHAHLLRARSDAILVGIGTAVADDPQLNVRQPGLEDRKPVRIVADPRLRLPLTSQMARTARLQPLWMLARPDADRNRIAAFRDLGAEVLTVGVQPGGELDLATAARELADRGLTNVLVEGGGRVAAALMRDGLIDRLMVFRAGLVMGGDGLPSVAAMGIERPAVAPHFRLKHAERIGGDLLETWARAA